MTDAAEAYERHALEFLQSREKSTIGATTVEQWARHLRKGASGVEIGCGSGYPVTRVLDKSGLRLWAVDSSPTLVAEFQSRFPHIPVQCAKVQDCDFFNRTFDFAVAIGLVFLLSESDQINLISRIADILPTGGRFLLTAPIETGSWLDTNTGIECNSPGEVRYKEIFDNAGFSVVRTYTDEGKNNYYDLERTNK